MTARDNSVINSALVELKLNGQSFREISERLGMPRGTVTSRYYRLKGVRHPSQVKRDEHVKKSDSKNVAHETNSDRWLRFRQQKICTTG
jgi:hypothetical protein